MANYTDQLDIDLRIEVNAHSLASAGDHDPIDILKIVTPEPPPILDTEAPIISNMSPGAGSELSTNDAIEFDVTDNSGAFARIFVVAYFPETGDQEVIFDGVAFVGKYTGISSRVPIALGFRYTVARSGGWLYAPTIRIFPIDAAGNQ